MTLTDYSHSPSAIRHKKELEIMPQGVDAAGLGDPGLPLGAAVHECRSVAGQRPVAMPAGEQPGTWTLVAPVVAELREKPLRQRHVAV